MSGVIKNFCQTCGVRPPAMREIPCCFECWPGGPVTPPPCRRCGSKENYYTSGLCSRCHHHAPGPKSPRWESPGKLRRRPVKVASCPDCLAWGVTARYGWMCVACKSWREKYGKDGQCATCGRTRAGQPGRVVPAVPQAPQPGRPAARPPDRDRHPGRGQRARPAAVHRRDLAPGRHDPPRVREEDRPRGHVAAAPGRAPAARLVRHAPGPAAGVVGQVPAATGPGAGGRVRPVRPRPRRRARLGQELHRHHPARASGSCSASRTPPARRSAAATSCC